MAGRVDVGVIGSMVDVLRMIRAQDEIAVPFLTSVKVAIVADDPIVRRAHAFELGSKGEIQIVGQFETDASAFALARTASAAVIVWDIGTGARDAIERVAGYERGSLPLVMLLNDTSLVSEAFAAGARGLLPRELSSVNVADALRAVASGLFVADPGLMASGLRERGGPRPSDDLTGREAEVLSLLAAGLANKTIASRLNISEHTVKFHVNAILAKLGVQSRTEAVVRAARLGLVAL